MAESELTGPGTILSIEQEILCKHCGKLLVLLNNPVLVNHPKLDGGIVDIETKCEQCGSITIFCILAKFQNPVWSGTQGKYGPDKTGPAEYLNEKEKQEEASNDVGA